MSARPIPTSEQAAAIGERGRDVFLRAGAGTGKTAVLVDRFCAAALDDGAGVERILAFTFTERAADQLRRRIRAELERRAGEAGDDRERAELLEMARASERAWISTIHGFCRRLLAAHPAAAGIDPRFRVLDEPEADRLAARAFDRALGELVEAGDPDALELAAANRRGLLLEMTRGAHDELRSQGRPSPTLPELPPPDTRRPLRALIEAAAAADESCVDADGRRGAESRERIARAARLDPGASPDPELLELLATLRVDSGAAAFRNEAVERYKRCLADARRAVAEVVLSPAYESLRTLIERFGGAYEQLKAERSALDFEDLQLRAVALLGASERLREQYRERFAHLMVDEFQDSNRLQLALIEQLKGRETRLFCVGDEFQSIYGFRHADVEVYRREQRRFAAMDPSEGVALPLSGNFRAAPELIAATNAIGAALLDGFEPLTVGSERQGSTEPQPPQSAEPAVELLLTLDDRGWGAEETGLAMVADDPSSPARVAEARRLAARLRELVDRGEDPAEIVVLLRAFTHVGCVERALADAGLDPYVVGGRGFWSQQQVEDLRCLLATLANPLDDEPLFGALASPAGGLLPDTLWLLRRAATEPGEGERERALPVWPLIRTLTDSGVEDGSAARIPADELERLTLFRRRVDELRAIGVEAGLEALVERAATSFGYDLATLSRDHGARRWANARKLIRLAREFEAREGPDLAAFLEYLDSRAARRDREAEAATRAEGHAGVRVMTVHAAKGLEFGVVAVADIGRRLNLGWTPLRVAAESGYSGQQPGDPEEATRVGVQLGRLGRPSERLSDYQQLTDLAAERESEEERRLAYVAVTRAKRRLILSGTYKQSALGKEPVASTPIAVRLIGELLGGEVEDGVVTVAAPGPRPGLDAPFAEGRIAVGVSAPAPGAGAALLDPSPIRRHHARAQSIEPPLGRPAVAGAIAAGLSYSALSDYARCGYRFYVERVLGIGAAAELGAQGATDSPGTARRFALGNAVHALLEWSARHRWRDPGSERAVAALRAEGIDGGGAVGRALAMVRGWLESPLREEIASAEAVPEAPFLLAVGGALVRGSIDVLVRRGNEAPLLVDYKTDRLDGADPAARAEGYATQRDLYSLAAAAGGPRAVETAYVFLEQPEQPIRETLGPLELEGARARLERLIAELGEQRYGVTPAPHRALCHDCPARHRLCSYERELRERPQPEPVSKPR